MYHLDPAGRYKIYNIYTILSYQNIKIPNSKTYLDSRFSKRVSWAYSTYLPGLLLYVYIKVLSVFGQIVYSFHYSTSLKFLFHKHVNIWSFFFFFYFSRRKVTVLKYTNLTYIKN